jgi:putative endonuclease
MVSTGSSITKFFEDIHVAIARETRLKKWNRQWKIDLIQTRNVFWDDLYETIKG